MVNFVKLLVAALPALAPLASAAPASDNFAPAPVVSRDAAEFDPELQTRAGTFLFALVGWWNNKDVQISLACSHGFSEGTFKYCENIAP